MIWLYLSLSKKAKKWFWFKSNSWFIHSLLKQSMISTWQEEGDKRGKKACVVVEFSARPDRQRRLNSNLMWRGGDWGGGKGTRRNSRKRSLSRHTHVIAKSATLNGQRSLMTWSYVVDSVEWTVDRPTHGRRVSLYLYKTKRMVPLNAIVVAS